MLSFSCSLAVAPVRLRQYDLGPQSRENPNKSRLFFSAGASQSQSIGNSPSEHGCGCTRVAIPAKPFFSLCARRRKPYGSVARRCVTATTRGEGAPLEPLRAEDAESRGASAPLGGTTDLDRGRLGRQEIRLRSTTPYRKLGTAPSKLVGAWGGAGSLPTLSRCHAWPRLCALRSLPRLRVCMCAVCVCVECQIYVCSLPPIAAHDLTEGEE